MIISITSIRFAVFVVAVAGILAGCSGGGTPTPVVNGASDRPQRQPLGLTFDLNRCPVDNGVSVHPCHVTLTTSNSLTGVRVTTPRHDKDGSITVEDRGCRRRHVALITGSGHSFTVSAGMHVGTCTAKFVDKEAGAGVIGTAGLDIINRT
jgi:hypothetical protein